MVDLRRQNHPGGNKGMIVSMRQLRMLPRRCCAAALLPAAFASGTAAWEMNSYADFVRGRFKGVSLSREGRLSLAPKVDTALHLRPARHLERRAGARRHALRRHRPSRPRLSRSIAPARARCCGPPTSPRSSRSPWIATASLYAGTSPDGKVYRIENGKAAEYFAPKARYIWSLAVGARWRPLRGHGRSGQGLPRRPRRQGRTLV